jgi:tetratricopeptide (TPR) repeat protein
VIDLAEIDDRIAKCNKILGENPNSQIFAALAEAYRKKGMLDEAFRTCQTGLRIHPKYVSAHMVMARINLDKGMYDWAEIEVNKAVVLEGSSFATDMLLAEIYCNRGEFTAAKKILKQLQQLDPGNKQILKMIELTEKIPVEAAQELELIPVEDKTPDTVDVEPDEKPVMDEKSEGISYSELLDNISSIDNVEGILLINREGLVADSRWNDEKEPDIYGALARDIENTIQSQLGHSRFGVYESLLIESKGLVINLIPSENCLLMIKANGRINLGSLRLKLTSLFENLNHDF